MGPWLRLRQAAPMKEFPHHHLVGVMGGLRLWRRCWVVLSCSGRRSRVVTFGQNVSASSPHCSKQPSARRPPYGLVSYAVECHVFLSDGCSSPYAGCTALRGLLANRKTELSHRCQRGEPHGSLIGCADVLYLRCLLDRRRGSDGVDVDVCGGVVVELLWEKRRNPQHHGYDPMKGAAIRHPLMIHHPTHLQTMLSHSDCHITRLGSLSPAQGSRRVRTPL